MFIRLWAPADRPVIAAYLDERYHTRVARLGALVHPLDHTALIAEEDGHILGVLTYILVGEQCEVLTIHATSRFQGVGSALMEALERLAAAHGCTRVWLVTTNDNVDALRFYQRRGYRLTAVRPDAVDDSRARLKPEIPRIGSYGIPLRDEIVLEKRREQKAGPREHDSGKDSRRRRAPL